MIINYLKIIFRNIRRFPAYSFINICGLAIGMTCTFLILLWVQDELSYDKFYENAGDLYRVLENQHYAGGEIFPVAVTPSGLAPALKEDFPEIIRAARYRSNYWLVQKDDGYITERFENVDQDFLEMFSIQFVKGNIQTALVEPHSVILTEEMAEKYFGQEDPIGRTLNVNKGHLIKVTGVIKKPNRNSHLDLNFLMPFIYLKETGTDINDWGNNSHYTYVQLQKNADSRKVNEKIKDLVKKYHEGSTTEIFLQNVKKIHLYSSGKFAADLGGHGDIAYVRIFSIVAIFVLLIACINFMNLSTAQSARRAKEIGLRKVAGAGKRKLITQFIGETIFIAFVAHIIAMILVEILLPTFNQLAGKQLDINYRSLHLYVCLLALVIFTGLLAGSYPAFFLSAFKPVNVLKGVLNKNPGNSGLRRVLVIIQFSLSVFLIICTMIIGNQLRYMQNKKLGLNKDNIGYFYIGPELRQKRNTLKDELIKNTDIQSACFSNQLPTYIINSTDGFSWEGKNPDDDILFHMVNVDEDYFRTFELELSEGRFFSADFPSDSSSTIINEKAAEIIGFKEPVGKTLSVWDDKTKIIGVVKNFHFKSVHNKIEPLVMYMNPDQYYVCFIRINPDHITATVDYIEKTAKKLDPDSPVYFNFLDRDYDNLYRAEKRMLKIFNYFSLLAIIISCLGLIGLSSYIIERRRKEVGIRKANGAGRYEIFTLLSKEFLLWVIVSIILASPVAWFAMNKWLQNFAYHTQINWWVFVTAGLAAISVALLTVSWQSYRSASRNPVEALRYE
jgi:putative ABC transport system permease protein